MIVKVAVPVPAVVVNRMPVTGYAMLEFEDVVPTSVGWSNQLPAVGSYPVAKMLSKVYCTLYVIVPMTITAMPILAGAM